MRGMAQEPRTLMEAVRYFSDPDVALKHMVELRWPDGIKCPTCGRDDVRYIGSLLASLGLMLNAAGFEDLLGNLRAVDADGPAAVKGRVGDHLDELFLGHAVVQRPVDVAPKLICAVEGSQHGYRNHAAVAL